MSDGLPGPEKQSLAPTAVEALQPRTTIAKSANVTAHVVVEDPIHVGPRVEFHSGTVGRYGFINADTIIYNDVHIGRFTTFARGCQIGGAEHPIHHLTTSFFGVSKAWFPGDPVAMSARMRSNARPQSRRAGRISIGNGVWIGAGAIVLKGVTIGDGAVVGAGAVVTKDVPPYAIVAGNPARVLRMRFDEATVARLLATRWWDLEPTVIAQLPLDEVDACLDKVEQIRRRKTTSNA